MTPVIGLGLFAGGAYLLATRTEASMGFWLGFALIALGLFSLTRSRRRGRKPPHASSGQTVRRRGRRTDGGGDGRSETDGEDGDGNGGDGGGDGGD